MRKRQNDGHAPIFVVPTHISETRGNARRATWLRSFPFQLPFLTISLSTPPCTAKTMLSRLRRRAVTPPDPDSINYTAEHVSHSKAIARRRRVTDVVSSRVPLIRWVP